MRRTPIALALLCAVLLCLGACAAPQEQHGPSQDAAGFAGIWEVDRLDDGQRVIQDDELERLRQLDLTIYLELSDDGSAVFRLFDAEEHGTWEAGSATEATMTLSDGEVVAMALEEGELSFSQDEDRLWFKRTDLSELPELTAAPGSDGAEAAAAAEDAQAQDEDRQ